MSSIKFVEHILDKVIKSYKFIMNADAKLILFKILHISIVIHSPQASNVSFDEPTCEGLTNVLKISIADDIELWKKQLRNMFNLIVDREITESRKTLNRSNSSPTICSQFVRMAAKLCAVVRSIDKIKSQTLKNLIHD